MNLHVNTRILIAEMTKEINQGAENNSAKMSAFDQEENRPEIDTIICQNLDGVALKNALFIVDNIRENKMKIKWSSVNVWTVTFRGRHVCDLTVMHNALRIGHVSDILATRVKRMTNDFEYTKRFVDAFTSSMVEEPATSAVAV